ncbi:hypothetical protein [Treponema zioleckii]|uniref:hypothetical protein n=1 Tax=Treponema zioleckii TaxID=331680 RepID=UPI00168A7AC1|nr:hypothetical protein [Treponema zioleckii]
MSNKDLRDVNISLKNVPLKKIKPMVDVIKKTVPGSTGSVVVSKPKRLSGKTGDSKQIGDNRR